MWVTVFETIGVFGVDGERQALLTMPPGWRPAGDHDPVWLPDGKSLVGWVWGPIWSPTGDRIAFTTWKRETGGVN
ncbi:MAG TPA: hypothetical protein VFM40_08335, partial [Actinomycetota bacterium]|nr:hypothetical protein [Actinomycetota bacterium]